MTYTTKMCSTGSLINILYFVYFTFLSTWDFINAQYELLIPNHFYAKTICGVIQFIGLKLFLNNANKTLHFFVNRHNRHDICLISTHLLNKKNFKEYLYNINVCCFIKPLDCNGRLFLKHLNSFDFKSYKVLFIGFDWAVEFPSMFISYALKEHIIRSLRAYDIYMRNYGIKRTQKIQAIYITDFDMLTGPLTVWELSYI